MLSGAAAAEDGKRRRLTESEWKLPTVGDVGAAATPATRRDAAIAASSGATAVASAIATTSIAAHQHRRPPLSPRQPALAFRNQLSEVWGGTQHVLTTLAYREQLTEGVKAFVVNDPFVSCMVCKGWPSIGFNVREHASGEKHQKALQRCAKAPPRVDGAVSLAEAEAAAGGILFVGEGF